MLTVDQITEIFFIADEYCQYLDQNLEQCMEKLQRSTDKRPYNRPNAMSHSEVITILICFHQSDFRTLKHFYCDYVCAFLKNEFPKLVSYNRFVELQQLCAMHLMMFLMTNCVGESTGISFIDSTKLAVCKNQRIHQHKVFKDVVQRGKTSTGWFYGFKLHFVVNDCGEIVSFKLTTENITDNNENVLLTLCKKVFGKLYGDKGYIVKESVFDKLFFDGVHLVTSIKKNMKNKLMSIYDKVMLRKRALIETIIDQLKNIAQIEHSRHRCLTNFITNIFAALCAYSYAPKKPSLKSNFEFNTATGLQLSL
jgi:hypothetical protein